METDRKVNSILKLRPFEFLSTHKGNIFRRIETGHINAVQCPFLAPIACLPGNLMALPLTSDGFLLVCPEQITIIFKHRKWLQHSSKWHSFHGHISFKFIYPKHYKHLKEYCTFWFFEQIESSEQYWKYYKVSYYEGAVSAACTPRQGKTTITQQRAASATATFYFATSR